MNTNILSVPLPAGLSLSVAELPLCCQWIGQITQQTFVIRINCERPDKQNTQQINYAAYDVHLHDDTRSCIQRGTDRVVVTKQFEVPGFSMLCARLLS